ncbi:hypothetical protein INS49_003504 [Diaporthe citri]|uniref:uncharacterized protein n=1 Tax=Diaporthe citri TaxID=83186 RepID=UPI001C810DFF|nr:uncharacterized protein INS49_003504 [Diaporthe citri]KAG6355542.1 hypothetical protein INS49_003504 [Diaporthe citri]
MPHRHRPVDVEDDEGYVKDLYLRLDKIRIASLRAEARRALSEQIASRPHIRVRRCTVVYQKPSGEFCKYYINKIVSFNTT